MIDNVPQWPIGCQRPARCEARKGCSYQLTADDFARERRGEFIDNPCPHQNVIDPWDQK